MFDKEDFVKICTVDVPPGTWLGNTDIDYFYGIFMVPCVYFRA